MIVIHKARPLDATAIQKLLKETWKDTYSDHLSQETLDAAYKNWQNIDFLTKQINNPKFYFVLAKKDSELLGIATAQMPEDTIILFRLYVYPKHQHQGVGTALLQDVIHHFDQAIKMQLHVEEFNPNRQNFYLKQGFKEIKQEMGTIGGQEISQILMEKEL